MDTIKYLRALIVLFYGFTRRYKKVHENVYHPIEVYIKVDTLEIMWRCCYNNDMNRAAAKSLK